jgi:excinuclease ABC subunit B
MSVSDTYIEKDLAINEEVDKLRLRATSSLLSGRRDIIIVASVSCIYGMGNPEDYKTGIIRIYKGQILPRNTFLYALVDGLYSRTETRFDRATFRVRGDTVDINLPYVDYGYRISFFGDEIDEIQRIEIESGKRIESLDHAAIFPANLYVAPKDRMKGVLEHIEEHLATNQALPIAQVEHLAEQARDVVAETRDEGGNRREVRRRVAGQGDEGDVFAAGAFDAARADDALAVGSIAGG